MFHTHAGFRYPKIANFVYSQNHPGENMRHLWTSSIQPISSPSSSIIVSIKSVNISVWFIARTFISQWHWIGTMCRVFLSIVCVLVCFNPDSAAALWVMLKDCRNCRDIFMINYADWLEPTYLTNSPTTLSVHCNFSKSLQIVLHEDPFKF